MPFNSLNLTLRSFILTHILLEVNNVNVSKDSTGWHLSRGGGLLQCAPVHCSHQHKSHKKVQRLILSEKQLAVQEYIKYCTHQYRLPN